MLTGITEDILVFLLAGGQGERLYPLTRDRAKPAVPFAGNYRIIDFTLTNCVHSGLRRVYVLTQYRSLSLERHVRSGYSFLSMELDEFIDTVPPQFRMSSTWYLGTADAVYQNIYLLERDRPKRTLILSGDHVYRFDYRDMLRSHLDREASMTIGVIEVPLGEARRMGVLQVDRDYRVVGFEEKPAAPKPIPGRDGVALASMGIYLFDTTTLVREVAQDAKTESSHDFGKDVVPHMVATGMKVFAFPFRDRSGAQPGYWRDVGTIDAYYEAHRDVLGENPRFDLRDPKWPLYSVRQRLPAAELRTAGGRRPEVYDSLIANGTVVAGATVADSVLGPDVFLGPGATVEQSLLLGRVRIGAGARLRRVIIDRHVTVPEGREIGCDPEADEKEFVRSPGGITVVPRRARLE
ncbi:MAG: glucose-1-phosphate adenylyltransferase [Planctomycetes bacterium]|nr:glucose-1-phosphate adenylyltransferase [Planctomycetota bacterium]